MRAIMHIHDIYLVQHTTHLLVRVEVQGGILRDILDVVTWQLRLALRELVECRFELPAMRLLLIVVAPQTTHSLQHKRFR